MFKNCILINTYNKFDFLVSPLIKLINEFWMNHPQIFVVGTDRKFLGTETIPISKENFKDWVSNYYESLQFLQKQGFEAFYLILDDLHPIGQCNSEYLNSYIPAKAKELNAGYIYLMAHFDLLQATECGQNGLLQLIPKTPYSISLQFAFWNLDYALTVTEKIRSENVSSIWQYETHGSTLSFSAQRSNFIIKQGTQCLLPASSIDRLPEKMRWHISQTPYPFVKGGFLYQGRSTITTRTIYKVFLGTYSEIKEMISRTTQANYLIQDIQQRIRRKLRFWFYS